MYIEPDSLSSYLATFAEHCLVRGQSARTIEGRECALRAFIHWCNERSLTKPQDITRPILERYRKYLYYYRMPHNDKPLTVATQRNRLTSIKVFFRWLARDHILFYNPASELELPRPHRRLPKAILTVDEVEAVCRQTLIHGEAGIRDRAVIETLYATGIRRQELTRLDLYDIDMEQGTLMIREDKNKKDRLLPIGERACLWIDKYLIEVRPTLVTYADEDALFLDDKGTRFTPQQLSNKVSNYLAAAGVTKPGSCHLFRHTMATLMLENGADIRFIQAMLGHADISTTQIYTHVSMRKLKEVYTRTHPAKHQRPSHDDEKADEKHNLAEGEILDALEQEAVEECT